jgi:hypothetical protein
MAKLNINNLFIHNKPLKKLIFVVLRFENE